MGRIRLANAEETIAFGRKMASLIPSRTILALSGDLGSGKTTFVQGLALGLGIKEPIQSPTFVILNIYKDLLYHFDLYRLKKTSDFTSLGFEEYFQKKGLCAIEWPDRIASLLPPGIISIDFSYKDQERTVEVRS
jgi:tRNA threonylcarbamoyladenosine biosynthesis protein TsaE